MGEPSDSQQALENAFRNREVAVKEREQAAKEAEIELRRKDQALSGWRSPLVVAVLATAVGAAGNAAVSYLNGTSQRQLEADRAEQARLLEMIKTGDPDAAAENLSFLVDAGLVTNPDLVKTLRAFLAARKPGSGPALPTASGNPLIGGITGADDAIPLSQLGVARRSLARSAAAVGLISIATSQSFRGNCTGFLIAPDLALTAGHCLADATDANLTLRRNGLDETFELDLPPLELRIPAMGNDNYAAVRLKTPVADAQVLTLSSVAPKVGDLLSTLYFRGSGQLLAVSGVDECKVTGITERLVYHGCDTGGGSSGAPLLRDDGLTVVGVHHGRTSDGRGGEAMRSDVIRASPALRGLVK